MAVIPAKTLCEDCGMVYPTVAHGRTCPGCGSGHTHLIQGNETMIRDITVPQEEEPEPAQPAPSRPGDAPAGQQPAAQPCSCCWLVLVLLALVALLLLVILWLLWLLWRRRKEEEEEHA